MDQKDASEIWIGTVEVRPLPGSDFLDPGDKGAFVAVTTWAHSNEEYKSKVAETMNSYGLFVVSFEDTSPFASRSDREFDDEIVDLIRRTSTNPSAVLYGTFHAYGADQ